LNQNTSTNTISYINGKLITLNDQHPIAESVTVSNGFITALDAKPEGQIIDLNGKVMIPGFCDSHLHLANLGRFLEELIFNNILSSQIIADMVQKKTKEIPSGNWILGRGWDQSHWDNPEFPDADVLDSISPNHPVALTRVDGHAIWLNKVARNLAGYNPMNTQPDGGRVINDCIFVDRSMDPVSKIIPLQQKSDIKRQVKNAVNLLNSRGITMVHDAWMTAGTLEVIRELIEEQAFSLSCYCMLASGDDKLLDYHFKNGPTVNNSLIIRSVKAFIDGALGSRGAALLEEYSDDPGNNGLILISTEKFRELAERCFRHGFQLNTHAIGDRGNRFVLDTYSQVLKGKNNHRWRVEHAQMVAAKDLTLFCENDIIPSMQPSHCTSDMRWMEQRIGSHRTSRISKINTFINNGLKVAGGSDCPIETGNPLMEFYAAVTRQDVNGYPESGWHAEERVPPLDALKMFTSWAAYSAFEEHRRGKIRQGYIADFTVLSNDITSINPVEILDTKILYTIIKGEIVYQNNQ
jgi:predicted amidohydrolase YtcJ